MSSSYPSYRYRAARSRDNQFLNKITLVRPLLTADGTDALIAMPSYCGGSSLPCRGRSCP